MCVSLPWDRSILLLLELFWSYKVDMVFIWPT